MANRITANNPEEWEVKIPEWIARRGQMVGSLKEEIHSGVSSLVQFLYVCSLSISGDPFLRCSLVEGTLVKTCSRSFEPGGLRFEGLSVGSNVQAFLTFACKIWKPNKKYLARKWCLKTLNPRHISNWKRNCDTKLSRFLHCAGTPWCYPAAEAKVFTGALPNGDGPWEAIYIDNFSSRVNFLM